MEAGRVEGVLSLLRAKGGRITTARRAILQALCAHSEHPTAEQLTAAVQAKHPEVHESTVYRFLEDLEELGIIDHVHLGHGAAVYHFSDDTHYHLVCGTCGKVVQVPEEEFAALRKRLRREHGFVMEQRHFALAGRCVECSTK